MERAGSWIGLTAVLHTSIMSEDSLQLDPEALRRALSTRDIRFCDVQRHQRGRISGTSHYPRYPTEHPPDPPIELLSIPETQPYRTSYGWTMAFVGYRRRALKARRELVLLIWNLCRGFVQVHEITLQLKLNLTALGGCGDRATGNF